VNDRRFPSGKSLQNGVSSSKSSHDNHVFRPKVKEKMELRLVVADDHDIVRRGLRDLLEAHVGWKVVAEAATGTDAVTKVREFSPDVAILDISMPSLNGLEAARRIIQSGSKTRILILTLHDSDRMIAEMLDAGVSGYVLKSDAARDVFVAVEALQHGKTFFTSKVAEMILSGYLKKRQNPSETEPGASRITSRQREILKLLAEGKANGDVAVALGMSVKTVETHRANILKRLNCHSTSDLVRYAVRNKIIEV
jgi:DNA-binding NarL/FixJ family response regulator